MSFINWTSTPLWNSSSPLWTPSPSTSTTTGATFISSTPTSELSHHALYRELRVPPLPSSPSLHDPSLNKPYWDNLSITSPSISSTPDVTHPDVTHPEEAAQLSRLLRHGTTVNTLLCVAYLLVFIGGLLGNGCVIGVVFRCSRMRSPTNFFIANLALADILVLIFCLPANLVSNIFYPWMLGRFMCKAVTYVQGVSVSASVNSLVAISVDRFMAICCGLRPHASKRRARMVIAFIWALPTLVMMPWPIFFDLRTEGGVTLCQERWPDHLDGNLFFLVANLVICYLLPLLLIILCYVGIWIKVTRRDIPGEMKGAQLKKIQERSKFKVVKMLMVVVVAFSVSWLPLYLLWFLVKFSDLEKITGNLQYFLEICMPIAQWLGASNSCVNPALYAYFNKKYREGFSQLLRSKSCCSPIRIESVCKSTMKQTVMGKRVKCVSPSVTTNHPVALARLRNLERQQRYRGDPRSDIQCSKV